MTCFEEQEARNREIRRQRAEEQARWESERRQAPAIRIGALIARLQDLQKDYPNAAMFPEGCDCEGTCFGVRLSGKLKDGTPILLLERNDLSAET